MMLTRKDLPSILDSWIRNLNLPLRLTSWDQEYALKKNGWGNFADPPKTTIIRGRSHWYADTKFGEAWILTIRDDHVEVRSDDEKGYPLGDTAISWHIIQAADPEFFTKLERDLRAAIDYLERN